MMRVPDKFITLVRGLCYHICFGAAGRKLIVNVIERIERIADDALLERVWRIVLH